jgi:flavin-dependent dehydrogenase
VRLRSPSGRVLDLALPSGRGTFAAIAPRVELDAALVDLARARGVTVREGTSVTSVVERDGLVHATLDDGSSVSAAHLVAADGMWSPVRKSLGLATPGYRGEWHAFRQYASGVTGEARDRLHVWFDDDLLPGYAWSFPLGGGRVNLGFGLLRGSRHEVGEMGALWRDLLARDHVRKALGDGAVLEGRHLAWPIPARVTDTTLASGRVLFVGDAACVTDGLTGEGIGQALTSGRLAAEAIAAGGGTPADVARRFRRSMRANFFADHRMSSVLGRILARRWGARGAIRVAGTSDWTRRNFVRWMFEDEPRAAVFTPRRWHRGFLDRDGAYASRTTVS